MNYEVKKLAGAQMEIAGEIPAADFDAFYQKTLKGLKEQTEIPGFRKGQAPENILKERLGEKTILEEAAKMAIEDIWPKILKEQNEKGVEIIGPPNASITKLAKGNPLGFKFAVFTMPEIELKDYKKIAGEVMAKKTEIIVEEKEIDAVLEYLKKSKVSAQGGSASGGKNFTPTPNFGVGARKLKINDEIDDEFAKSVGHFQTLEQLKNSIKENLTIEKQAKEREKKRIEMLDKIAEKSKMEIPEILIEAEKEKMLQEMKASIENMGLKWEDYLKHIKKTEEELKGGWQDDALRRVKHGLILREIAEREKIEVSEEEISQKTAAILKTVPEEQAEKIDKSRLKDYAYGVIRNEKVFRILEEA